MKQNRRRIQVALLSLAALGAFTPSAFSADGGLRTSEAKCATCCPEKGSTCVVGDIAKGDYYYKESGSCSGGDGTEIQ